MIVAKSLTAEQVHAAIERGEFTAEVVSAARNVAVIMTQSWCGQWFLMRHWIGKEARKDGGQSQPDIEVFILEYDREPFFEEFLAFKERVFGNSFVPYVRFYREGRLVHQTNYVSRSAFFEAFT